MKRSGSLTSNDKIPEKELVKLENGPKKYKRKYPGFRKNVHDYFTEFTENTGIHGFKYMGEQNRSVFEKYVLYKILLCYNIYTFFFVIRIFWVLLFCVSLYFCIGLIIQTWVKWDQSPVLVSFARSPTPVWQIPFPAVTICSETKMRQRKFNFTDVYNKYTKQRNITEEE